LLNKIIICSNIAGAGKDEVAKYLETKYGFTQFAFADKIREIAIDLFDMKNKDRYLLQQIGQKLREIDSDCWTKYVLKKTTEKKDLSVVISDLRQRNEYESCIKYGYFPVRVVADREIAIKRLIERDGCCDESLLDNESEIGTRGISMLEIYNNGSFEELHKQIDSLMELEV
jgi:dephospho-CoA kinase